MGDTTIKLLGLTKVSLRVYYWFFFMTSVTFTYTLRWKRGSKLHKKIKFLSLKYGIF